MNRVVERAKQLLPRRDDNPDIKYFKIVVYSLVGIMALTVIAGVTTFLFTLQGTEEIMVPDIRDAELSDALIELQQRELFPLVQKRYASDPATRGRVLDQNPAPGTVVKAGKRISVIVSEGAVVDEVGDYRGRDLNEVRSELRTVFASYDQVLDIANVSYVFDESEPGTIVEQHPAPGTPVAGQTNLDVVVSRGPGIDSITVPSYVGMTYDEAVQELASQNTPFSFRIADDEGDEDAAGTVVSQSPSADSEMEPGSRVTLYMLPPEEDDVPEDMVFGIFERVLPEYPVAVELTLDVVNPDGQRLRLLQMQHPGGIVSVPYMIEENSRLVLSRFGTEVVNLVIRPDED